MGATEAQPPHPFLAHEIKPNVYECCDTFTLRPSKVIQMLRGTSLELDGEKKLQ